MGSQTAKKKGIRSKKKEYKRNVWLCNRDKDIDQIQDEFEKAIEKSLNNIDKKMDENGDNTILDPSSINPAQIIESSIEYNDQLPGGGQFYCAETDRHFIDGKALADHKKTKFYKRRCKELKNEKYTQGVADWGAGMSKEILPPVHKVENKNKTNK